MISTTLAIGYDIYNDHSHGLGSATLGIRAGFLEGLTQSDRGLIPEKWFPSLVISWSSEKTNDDQPGVLGCPTGSASVIKSKPQRVRTHLWCVSMARLSMPHPAARTEQTTLRSGTKVVERLLSPECRRALREKHQEMSRFTFGSPT